MNRTVVLTLWIVALGAPRAHAQLTPREAVATLVAGSSPTDVSAVATSVANQIASVPLGSSSGGFTFVRDPQTGSLRLKAETFGPSFAERPTTLGKRGAFSFGTNSQRTRFQSFEGLGLRDGDFKVQVTLDGQPVSDLFAVRLDVSTVSTSFFANVGVTRTLDVGVTVPFVRLSLGGVRSAPGPDETGGPIDLTAAGLGDIQVRAKWAPIQNERAALGAGMELRLPTADEQKLMGTGRFLPKALLLASANVGRVSPHLNLSYQYGGPGAAVRVVPGGIDTVSRAGASSEFGYTVGVEVAAHPTITLSGELIGQSLRNTARFRLEERGMAAEQSTPATLARFNQLARLGRPGLHTLNARVDNLNTWLVAGGIKTTILQRGLVRFDLLHSLSDEGLRPGLTTVIGFEFTF